MNENIILNYLRDNKTYVFKVGDFILPKKLEALSGNKIDLELNRSNILRKGSFWSPKFESYILNYKIRYLKEVPLILEDNKLWEYLCNKYKVPEIFYKTNYFFADYLFLDYKLMVEVDSSLHNTNYDSARDEYIHRTWGIYTLRFYEFGKYSDQSVLYINELKRFISDINRTKYLYSLSNPLQFDYSSILLRQFNKDHFSILPTMKELEEKIFDLAPNNFKSRNYIIQAKDLSSSSIKVLYDKSSMNRIKSLFSSMYGINISINL